MCVAEVIDRAKLTRSGWDVNRRPGWSGYPVATISNCWQSSAFSHRQIALAGASSTSC
jgi:hypothetical protein